MERSRSRHWISFNACLLFAMTLAPIARGLDLQSKIDPLAKPLIENGSAVGFIVGIYKDGETQILSYGEITKGSRIKPHGKTVYEIGSASKVFTGVLLADLLERGKLKLDDPMKKYLPVNVRMPIFEGQAITLKHMVTHTSGLPRLPGNLIPANPADPYADYTENRMYGFLTNHTLRRAPGQYEYSNYAMGLLGYTLATGWNKSYEQCVVAQIADPLGMDDTRIKLNLSQRRRFATPYDAGLNQVSPWDLSVLAGAGGIRSTANDMLKFIRANLINDDQPITRALQRAHQKQDGIQENQLGLAWHIAGDGITRWHNGMTGGYASWLAVVPSRNLGVVVLSNTASGGVTPFGQRVTQIVMGNDVQPPNDREGVKVDPAVLKKHTGVYEIVPEFQMTVTLSNGRLFVQATGQTRLELFPKSPTRFFCKAVTAQITFVSNDNGRPSHLVLHQNGRDQKAMKK